MPLFRKRPVVIEAVRVDGPSSVSALVTFMGAENRNIYYVLNQRTGCGWITTLEGQMKFSAGDWIIRGVKGEFYSCKPDIFAATYELVEEPGPALARRVITFGDPNQCEHRNMPNVGCSCLGPCYCKIHGVCRNVERSAAGGAASPAPQVTTTKRSDEHE